MRITREGEELILRLPLRQASYDALDKRMGDTDNLIGVIAGSDYYISQLVDLGYKGHQQEGTPYIVLDDEKQLRAVCKEMEIDIWEHPVCTFPKCNRVLRGVMTYGENGVQCCEHES